ncbi:MAG: AtpZ/AtpI family protein [Candidatus Gracilibacteria bacterium]|jgi:F0F1-type ATP synthase assembly protein I
MKTQKEKNEEERKVWTAYELALTLGYMIIIPILVFGVGGVILDKYLGSTPIFIFVGFILAMTASMLIVYVKMKDIVVAGIPKKNNKSGNSKLKNVK